MRKIRTIWSRCVKRRRVLERMRGVGVEESAAVGAELLDGFLRGDRPLRDHLRRAFERRRLRIGSKFWITPCEAKTSAATKRDRQQDVDRRARDVDPEVADGLHLVAREAAHQRDGDRHAGRRRCEVLHRERRHLHEVAHRRLADIRLPVRVRHEADGRVEREIRRERRRALGRLRRAEALRIERQPALQPLDQIRERELRDAEREQRARVLRPVLLDVFAYAAQAVDEAFERTKHRMQERALALKDLGHEGAHGPRQGHDHEQVEHDLQKADGVMASSEPLGPKQRVNQVAEDQNRGDTGNDVVH